MSPDRDDRSGAPDPDVDALFAQIVAGWDVDETSPVPPWPATEDLPDRTGPGARRDRGERRTDRTDPAERSDRPDRGQPTDRTGDDAPDATEPTRPPRAAAPAPERAPDPTAPQAPDRADAKTGERPGDRTGDRTGDRPNDRPAAADDARPALPGPPSLGPRDWAAADEPDEGYVPPEPPPLPRGDLVSRLAWAGVLLGPAFLLLSALLWDDAGPLPLALAALAFVGGFVTLVSRLPARRDDDDDDGAVV